MDFDSFLLASGFKMGQGIPPKQAAVLREKHAAYLQKMAESRIVPEVRELEMPMTGRKVIAMGNTLQVLPDGYAPPSTATREDGVLLNVVPAENRALVMTNTDGSPVRLMQKPGPWDMPEFADAIAAKPKEPQEPGLVALAMDTATAWAKDKINSWRPQPAPSPGTATNAVTPAPAPSPAHAYRTAEEVRTAFKAGKIDQAAAVAALQGF